METRGIATYMRLDMVLMVSEFIDIPQRMPMVRSAICRGITIEAVIAMAMTGIPRSATICNREFLAQELADNALSSFLSSVRVTAPGKGKIAEASESGQNV